MPLTPITTLRRGNSVRLLRVPPHANPNLPAEIATLATSEAHEVVSALPTGDGSFVELRLQGLPPLVLPAGDHVELS